MLRQREFACGYAFGAGWARATKTHCLLALGLQLLVAQGVVLLRVVQFASVLMRAFSRDAGRDTARFRRLVLGWIEADFRVQIHILQHFS